MPDHPDSYRDRHPLLHFSKRNRNMRLIPGAGWGDHSTVPRDVFFHPCIKIYIDSSKFILFTPKLMVLCARIFSRA